MKETAEKGSLLRDADDGVEFHLFGYYNLACKAPPITWRHRLYWRLRRCIDWIHP